MSQEEILDKVLIKLDTVEDQVGKLAIKVVNIEEKLDISATKDDLIGAKDEILGGVARFVKLHETLDQELAALRHKYSRLEERLEIVEKRLQVA